MDDLPLLRRFPALAALPRVRLGGFPTPVERIELDDGRSLLVKRDDRCGGTIGGNKLRALEWLLGGITPGERVLTVGARGSTHALTTTILAARIGATTTVVRWDQALNDIARQVDARTREEAGRVIDARFVAAAYAIAGALRLRGMRWIPAGATSPRGALGHVNAALELAEQIQRGECEMPEEIVVPLGTGGTAAGLVLGLRIAGLAIPVIGVRVVPRIVARARRVLTLANRCADLIERVTGAAVPRVSGQQLAVEQAFFGGAYGRALPPIREEASISAAGIALDDTYSRKAFMAAASRTKRSVLFWLTFDARLISSAGEW